MDHGQWTLPGKALLAARLLCRAIIGAVFLFPAAVRAADDTDLDLHGNPADAGALDANALPTATKAETAPQAPLSTDIGPAVPADVKLVNIARFANLRSVPYMTRIGMLVDPDPQLRTTAEPEPGTPAKGVQFDLRFAKPQSIAGVCWSVPGGKWEIRADTTGNGTFDKELRSDASGKIVNPGGVWVSRAWIRNHFWPAEKAYAIRLTNPDGPMHLYDVQILVPAATVPVEFATPVPAAGVPALEEGAPLTVPEPTVAQQFTKGYHAEPWMMGVTQWVDMKPRPPLTEFKPFKDFVAEVKRTHANYINLWPPRTFGKPAGKGTYETPVLWPSHYERHDIPDNALKEIAAAFQKEGITFFVMDRVAYPKTKWGPTPPPPPVAKPKPTEPEPGALPEARPDELEAKEEPKPAPAGEPPPEPTGPESPLIDTRSREYIAGIAGEQAAAGVNGVGVGFDEQWGPNIAGLKVSAFTRQAFAGRYHLPFPEKIEDSEACRKWLLFIYEEFAGYLQSAAAAAKAANPKVITNSPITVLDTAWNNRMDWGVAHDVIGHRADIDVLRASGYLAFENIGHYITAANVKRVIGATKSRGATALHNCPWAPDPVKSPGFYLHFPPVYMYGPPISAFMNGAKIASYWRQNFIYYGGYDKYVEQGFALLDTLAAWGGKDAQTPRAIVVLRSRASEDWWQLRQRHGKGGNPMDQTRGFLCEKWLLEFLFTHGYPFELRYLDYPEDLQEVQQYALAILPFPYSLSQAAFQQLAAAQQKGMKLLLFDRQGDTDEFGNAYPKPLLAEWVARNKATFFGDDLPTVGHEAQLLQRVQAAVDSLLGARKPIYVESYGNDVEVTLREKATGERFLCVTNWTDRTVTVDLGLTSLPAGNYTLKQRDLTRACTLRLGGKDTVSAPALAKFRLTLDSGAVKLICITPVP